MTENQTEPATVTLTFPATLSVDLDVQYFCGWHESVCGGFSGHCGPFFSFSTYSMCCYHILSFTCESFLAVSILTALAFWPLTSSV